MVSRTRVCALVCLLALASFAPLPVSGATPGDSPVEGAVEADVSEPAVSAAAQANNSTEHHRRPDNVSESGDLLGLRDWLSGRLGERLGDSAVQLEQGEYERARSMLGDDYDSRLEQYVDVVGETENESDDDNAESYRNVQRDQRNLSSALQEYEETYEDYEQARQAGDDEAAREHGRELQRLNQRIQRLNQSLARNYDDLENQTGANFTTPVRSIENVSEDVETRQQEINEALFFETELRLAHDNETISYAEPLVARGQILTANETVLDNRTVEIRIENRTKTVQTDEQGIFQFRYRPRAISANRSTLRIRYVPRIDSEYLPSNATVDVGVEQVEATLAIEESPDSVGFGDQLGVTTRLSVDGEPVSGVPVAGSVDDIDTEAAVTGEAGTAELSGTVPATLATGDQEVTVATVRDDAAVVAGPVTETVTVEATPTDLTLNGSRSAGTVRLSGRLTTASGNPVSQQPVTVTVDEVGEQTVRTAADGTYAVTVDASQVDATAENNVTVTAAFDGAGLNLESSSATTTVAARSAPGSISLGQRIENLLFGGGDGDGMGAVGGSPLSGLFIGGNGSILGTVAVTLVGMIVVATGLFWRLRGGSEPEEDETGEPGDVTPGGETEAGADDGADPGIDLDVVEEFIQEGNSRAAVEYTYQRLRAHLGDRFDADESDTHWEFFEACRENGLDGERLAAVRELVEAYEVLAFYQSAPQTEVESVVERVGNYWSESRFTDSD